MARAPETLTAFKGAWRLERKIVDHLQDQTGHLTGSATFNENDQGMLYSEEGELSFPGQPNLTASRSYLWREAGNGMLEVRFADERPFHSFTLKRTMPEADHMCDPDFYHVTYDFTDWPRWSCTWRVRGPRKDYRMISHYSR